MTQPTSKVFLLDLNYTLVSNSEQKIKPFTDQIASETYDEKLLAMLRDRYVVLITARPQMHKEATLASLLAKTGWQPEMAYYNDLKLPPPILKERKLSELLRIVKLSRLVAIESNPQTRAMYLKWGIPAFAKAAFKLPPA